MQDLKKYPLVLDLRQWETAHDCLYGAVRIHITGLYILILEDGQGQIGFLKLIA
tara:strand:- start:4801 stop:4962 length:162 start_codon:yes stop_codon:yes gene_type:complete